MYFHIFSCIFMFFSPSSFMDFLGTYHGHPWTCTGAVPAVLRASCQGFLSSNGWPFSVNFHGSSMGKSSIHKINIDE